MRRIILIVIVIALGGCTLDLSRILSLPQAPAAVVLKGDPVRGKDIFTHGVGEAPPCVSCHTTGNSAFSLGPKLTGVSQRAGERLPDMSAQAYLLQSIVDPSAFVVSGYRNIMYPQFGAKLSEQDIADLVAYLETL